MGEEQLVLYLGRLIEVSELKVLREFEEAEDPRHDFKNFKLILKKQKQMLSFISSYSFIVKQMK